MAELAVQAGAQVTGSLLLGVGVGLSGQWWHGLLAAAGANLIAGAFADWA